MARTQITYASSASHYLRDLRAGRGWTTRLPSHVVVVDRLEVVDEVRGTVAGSRYEYHDGFLDGGEQAFGGFALVDEYDLADGEGEDRDAATAGRSCTRVWYHTGDPVWHSSLADAYAGDMDPGARPLRALTIAEPGDLTGEEHADALRCLAGTAVRAEVYAVEHGGAEGDVLAPHPITVTQTRWQVRRLQPADLARGDRAVLDCHAAERITHHYERAPDDPRVIHWLALEVNPAGQVTLECDLAYPRRPSAAATAAGVAAQAAPVATASRSTVTTVNTPGRHELGIDVQDEEFELRLPAVVGAPADHGELRAAVQAALLAPLGPHQPFAPAGAADPQARRTSWERTFYWDDDATAVLPLGEVGERTLLHHEERACFTDELIDDVFGDRVDQAMLTGLGYLAADGFWWAADATEHHDDADGFYQLVRTERFDQALTTFTWDPHRLAVSEVEDAAGNRTVAEIDYHRLVPWRVTDANGTVREAAYDPLGVTVLTSAYGTVLDAAGNQVAYGHRPLAAYTPQADTSAASLLADPARFVQDAAEVVAYDLGAWGAGVGPPRTVTLTRESLVDDGRGAAPAEGPVQMSVSYLDGLGRLLQERTRVEPGDAVRHGPDGNVLVDAEGVPLTAHSEERWLVSGRVELDAREHPVRESEPYFSPGAAFEDDEPLARFGATRRLSHDALGRNLRVDEPDGTSSLAEYLPWEVRRHDRNDTVADSRWRLERDGLPATDPAREALEGALAHAGTPVVAHLDSLGREVRTVEPTGDGDQVVTATLDGRGAMIEATDPRGRLALSFRRDLRGLVLATNSIDAGGCWTLPDALDREAHRWDARGVHLRRNFDRLDRPVETFVDGALGLANVVEQVQYGDDPAVAQAAERNARGRVVRHRDQAGVVTVERYDPFGNPLRSARRLRAGLAGEPDWSEPDAVELEGAHVSEASWDALGRVLRVLPPDGSIRTTEYLRGGGVARLRWALADGTGDELMLLDRVELNARGQRTSAALGNGVTVEHHHDPDSFRTVAITATRPARDGQPARVLQQLAFTYDPEGNVTHVVDGAQEPTAPTPLLQGATVTSARAYTYDAAYRLRTATGRVHQALLEHDHRPGAEAGGAFRGSRRIGLADGQAVERYTQRFGYDLAGNLTSIQHQGQTRSWTTELWVSSSSNRSLPHRDLNGVVVDPAEQERSFDAAGNCTRLPHLRELVWSYRGRIARAVVIRRQGGADDAEHYLDDADGQRVRKLAERLVAGEVETTEKLYLDGCEIKRVRRGGELLLERVTSVVSDGERRVALVHRWTADTGRRERDTPGREVHYPLHDQVGSAVLELDDAGEVAAYEELLPYGGSAFVAGEAQRAARKDHRFAGKERDDATGLYDFGYRSYAPWIGRWLSPDPAGAQDSLNLYAYALGNPVSLVDPDGLKTRTREPPKTGQTFLGFVSQIPPLLRPGWNQLGKPDQLAVFEGRKTLYYDLKTKSFSLLDERGLRARARTTRIGIWQLGRPPPAPPAANRPPASEPPRPLPQAPPETTKPAQATGPGQDQPPPPTVGDGAGGGDEQAASPPAAATGEGQGAGDATQPGPGTGPAGQGAGAGLRDDGAGGGGAAKEAGLGARPGGSGFGATGAGAGAVGEDPGGDLGGERDQAGLPPPPEATPAEDDIEAINPDPGGVEGGGEGGVAGGTVGGASAGEVDPKATVVPGLEEADPNGGADGARFGTRGGTGAVHGRQGPPRARPDGRRGSGGPEGMVDRLVRYAGYAELELQGRTGSGPPRGIPGGFGKGEPGTATKLLYIACVVGGLLLGGAALIKSLVKKIIKLGLKGALKLVLRRTARAITRTFWEDRAGSALRKSAPLAKDFFERWRWLFGKGKWTLEHAWIKQRWYRGPNPTFAPGTRMNWILQKLGDSGLNLYPLPRGLNSKLFHYPKVSALVNAGVYGGSGYGVYKVWSWGFSMWEPVLGSDRRQTSSPSAPPRATP